MQPGLVIGHDEAETEPPGRIDLERRWLAAQHHPRPEHLDQLVGGETNPIDRDHLAHLPAERSREKLGGSQHRTGRIEQAGQADPEQNQANQQ